MLTHLPAISEKPRTAATSGSSAAMSRTNISVAKFYDWTDDKGSCFSVSSLYMEMANISGASPRNCSKIKTNVSSTMEANANVFSRLCQNNNSTRAYTRDKKTLTRGEREIIEGIHKNKRDTITRDHVEEFQIKDTFDGLCNGKINCESPTFGRNLLQGERIYGKSFRRYEQKQCKSSSSEDNSLHQPSSNSQLFPLASCSKLKYSSLRPLHQERGRGPLEPQEMYNKVKMGVNVGSKGSSFEETTLCNPDIVHSQQNETSELELQGSRHMSNATRSKSTSKKLVRNSQMLINLDSNFPELILLNSTRNIPLHENNVKDMPERRMVSGEKQKEEDTGKDVTTTFGAFSTDNTDTSSDTIEKKDNTSQGSKKIIVRIYLPSVEPEHIGDDEVPTIASVDRLLTTKERPLRHMKYKDRYNGKTGLDLKVSFLPTISPGL